MKASSRDVMNCKQWVKSDGGRLTPDLEREVEPSSRVAKTCICVRVCVCVCALCREAA